MFLFLFSSIYYLDAPIAQVQLVGDLSSLSSSPSSSSSTSPSSSTSSSTGTSTTTPIVDYVLLPLPPAPSSETADDSSETAAAGGLRVDPATGRVFLVEVEEDLDMAATAGGERGLVVQVYFFSYIMLRKIYRLE
jgi:hypothetical protein